MIYYQTGSPATALSADDLKKTMFTALENMGEKQKVLVIPPDYTRLPSIPHWVCGPLKTDSIIKRP